MHGQRSYGKWANQQANEGDVVNGVSDEFLVGDTIRTVKGRDDQCSHMLLQAVYEEASSISLISDYQGLPVCLLLL